MIQGSSATNQTAFWCSPCPMPAPLRVCLALALSESTINGQTITVCINSTHVISKTKASVSTWLPPEPLSKRGDGNSIASHVGIPFQ